jgi:DNA (cytosine-5)-methyltransferase 1
MRPLQTVGLFAGIGGLERGLERAGHKTISFCEIDPVAQAVLRARFPGVELVPDVEEYGELPARTELVTAGFPCQDLSQAGRTLGINDGSSRSGLVGEVIRLLLTHDPKWVLLENVPFMLHLARGRSLEVLIESLEALDFRWAYRVVNTLAFGLPQRRERVYLLASRTEDPRNVLLADDVGDPPPRHWTTALAVGFYWTEGTGGLGWAVDAVPTLKGGSTIGIPSSPAVVMPNGDVVTPSIIDAERLQGFEADWTLPAEEIRRQGFRWKLVGNAVTVDVAEWIGHRLRAPGEHSGPLDTPLPAGTRWPRAAYNVGEGRFYAGVSSWPVHRRGPHLHEFLTRDQTSPLSFKAISGFLARYEASTLKKPERFLKLLRAHKARMERQNGD